MSVPPEILDELYGLPPQDFTAARDSRAKEARTAGDRNVAAAVKKLARPSAAAWAVNRLVRRDPVRVHEVVELGEDLARAQAELDGTRLRELSRRRHAVVSSAVRAAVDLAREADRPLSDAAIRQVEATLQAAMAHPDAAERVRSGRLTESLEPAGFGPTSVPGDPRPAAPAATAPTPTPRQVTPAVPEGADGAGEDGEEETETEAVRAVVESARRRAREAQEVADRAREALAAAEERLDATLDAQREAGERVRALRQQVRQAEQDVATTERAAESAGRDRDEAARVADRARRAHDAALRRLQALGLDPDA